MEGVSEDASAFVVDPQVFAGRGRFRTFGADGPLYEVLSVGSTTVRIHVFDNGEELDYRIDRALADSVAN